MEIGVQFYTLRDYCKTLDDFAESLKKVADIGYKTVQISGTCEYDPTWLKKELDKNGLKCAITHTSPDKMKADIMQVVRDHEILDCDYVGLGCHHYQGEKEGDSYDEFIRDFTPVIDGVHEGGKYFMYHNHDHEFELYKGKRILDRLVENFPAEKFGVTLDVFWVQAGGGDPAWWLENLKGRVPCIHLKDYSYGRKMAVVGEGNMNFDRIFEKAKDAGTKYMLVEQDDCNGENPFDCLRRSYEFLKSRGF